MGSLAEIARLSREAEPRIPMEATVADPPLDEDGWVRVTLDRTPGTPRACPWVAPEGVTPSAGDAALVWVSDAGNWWAMVWPVAS